MLYRSCLSVVATVAGLWVASSAGAVAADGYFSAMAGDWSGGGSLTLVNGQVESIRCKVTYAVDDDGNTLDQKLRCASDSYRFDVKSSLSYNKSAGTVRGDWRDSENGVGGLVTGQARTGLVKAHVEGTGFSADIEASTQGGQQAVTIRPKGTNVSEFKVELSKS